MEDNNEAVIADDTPEQDNGDVPDESPQDTEEEEEECRVCRGPVEEGRPLFAPCKCSGSIGLTHQDCLMSWLEVTRGDGRCELCKTKFRFDPQYAENTPDRLPAHEVLLGLSSRALARWIPLACRIIVAASLWLLIAPLLTTFLYHGWMHRPSSILTRWQRDLIPSDIVSGAIIAAIVIISFLSLMSFADFLRVHWQQPPRQEENGQQRRDVIADAFDDDTVLLDDDGGINETIVEKRAAILRDSHNGDAIIDQSTSETKDDENEGNEETQQGTLSRTILNSLASQAQYHGFQMEDPFPVIDDAHQTNYGTDGYDNEDNHDTHSDGSPDPGPPPFDDEDGNPPEDDFLQDDDLDDDQDDLENEDANDDIDPFPVEQNNDMNNRPFDPLDPGVQDDQVDMEINVALDELLGLRGPLSTLVRNLLWLLAFNATYLGIFAFLPKTVGAAVYTGILNTTTCETILKSVPFMYSEDKEQMTLIRMVSLLNAESSRQNTTFRLPDVATVTLGYFSIATIIVLFRYGWVLLQNVRQRLSVDVEQDPNGERAARVPREARQPFHDIAMREGFEDPDPADVEGETALGAALDATVAVVKVGVLLFLKMFFLPLLLGLWLDASTTGLFGHTAIDRITFAGGDLFSFILLHWVAGITFMLLVTVFLLQLREVAHPDLLARMIRPQEPQPDLLGNLMHETVATHMKRMFLSLGIYAPLLTMHVTLPVKLFMASGLGSKITFFHLNFWHLLMPKMQIPLELIIFHLSMLALLERYKNSIGGLQHRWMVFMCKRMGLTEYILPRSVSKFKLYGTREILSTSGDVDAFWYELAGATKDVNQLIEANIDKSNETKTAEGTSKENGQRVLSTSFDYIRLPSPASSDEGKQLLPTKLGKYRLKVAGGGATGEIIEFWREVPGEEISRPPEGWDDLGVGGAFVQGRWAWANERKSTVEWSVAQRTPFKASEKQARPLLLMLKVVSLLVLSWFAITLTVLFMFSVPLAVGRSLYYLFRVPPQYIHDPLAFCIGGCLVFPMISLVYRRFRNERESPIRHIRAFISRLHAPPRQKLLVVIECLFLWLLVAPLALGASYEIVVVKTHAWFSGEESFADVKSVLFCWLLGTVVLHTWAFLAYFSVFTRTFWANLGNGILEPPVDENGVAAAGRNNRGAGDAGDNVREGDFNAGGMQYHAWQGKRGRVDRFFNVWVAILTRWDWDTVDRISLLEEFARPITKQIASALMGSSLSYQLILFAVPIFAKFVEGGIAVPLFGVVERGLLKMVLFRICMAVHIMVQVGSASKSRLEIWFQAAHDAARDDRYLIGEILMNYDPDQSD